MIMFRTMEDVGPPQTWNINLTRYWESFPYISPVRDPSNGTQYITWWLTPPEWHCWRLAFTHLFIKFAFLMLFQPSVTIGQQTTHSDFLNPLANVIRVPHTPFNSFIPTSFYCGNKLAVSLLSFSTRTQVLCWKNVPRLLNPLYLLTFKYLRIVVLQVCP